MTDPASKYRRTVDCTRLVVLPNEQIEECGSPAVAYAPEVTWYVCDECVSICRAARVRLIFLPEMPESLALLPDVGTLTVHPPVHSQEGRVPAGGSVPYSGRRYG